MTEKDFHRELKAAMHAAGYWSYKIPDQPVSRMQLTGDGKLRFTVPKPCDLIAVAPDGRAVLVECKLSKARSFQIDDHIRKQVGILLDVARRGAHVGLSINFRYEAKRPAPAKINRAFVVQRVEVLAGLVTETSSFTLADAEVLAVELPRLTGGWRLPADLWRGGTA